MVISIVWYSRFQYRYRKTLYHASPALNVKKNLFLLKSIYVHLSQYQLIYRETFDPLYFICDKYKKIDVS